MAKEKTPAPVSEDHVRLEGSERQPVKGATLVGPADPEEKLTVSIRVRRKPGSPELPTPENWANPSARKTYTREEFAELFGASKDDLDKVLAFADKYGLSVVEKSSSRRTVVVSGTVRNMEKAFKVKLGKYRVGKDAYRGREGHVHVPGNLIGIVEGVFGLDNRRMAKRNGVPGASLMTPPQVASLYNFPTASASGETIGILEFGGGYTSADINAFFSGLGLTAPALTDVGVDGSTNSPGDPNSDGEVALDIDVAGSVAQGAAIAMYFTPWTEQGWIDAVTTAVHDATNKPSVLSISWGWAEKESALGLTWTPAAINAVSATFQEAAVLGVTVFAASGDAGSDDAIGDGKAHVDYPASDPWVCGCGGTVITNVSGSSFNEGTWNDDIGATGGGISDIFPVPSWQSAAGLPVSVNAGHTAGRGVPDIAGNASPYSGYNITSDGSTNQTGGTSAVAPLYAGLIAVINAEIGAPVGYLNPTLYGLSGSGAIRDIADGGNNGYNGAPGYTTGAGWDAGTGLGVLHGNNLLASLKSIYHQSLYFIVDKNTYGTDEVTDVISVGGGLFANAFWVVLEGFSIHQVGSLVPALSGPFHGIPGIAIFLDAAGAEYEMPGDLYTPQRIRFPFDIVFTSAALSSFPSAGSAPLQELLTASITVNGNNLAAEAVFELVAGADPYFTNIDPANNNVFYLSQDLRVFSAADGDTPVFGGPAFTNDPYASIQSFLNYLNTNSGFTTPGPDPLNALPGQTGYETGDSSVTPLNTSGDKNYNFAIARVRLRGMSGSNAANVRVFFRLFVAQSSDTDFQPSSTYLSQLGTSGPDAGNPVFPLPSGSLTDPQGYSLQTIPFFATDANGTHDYDGTNPNANIRTVQIPSGQDATWAYFGCFLDVYDAGNQSHFPGTHHCIVAQIADDDAPIVNSNGVTMSPENSDKLAQRNLEITSSGNPGYPATHIIPQAFDTRPSALIGKQAGQLLDYPDELMIDWGNVPAGSVASIFWPQVMAKDVLDLASKLYGIHPLSAADVNTIKCKVTKGVTYVPIPYGSGKNFAGLFTVDLPNTVHYGQEFNIKVRRVSSRKFDKAFVPQVNAPHAEVGPTKRNFMRNWRYVTGTFQVKIPVRNEELLLLPEENTLAIFKWRLENMKPVYRWYRVLQRYISYIAGRVDGFGGNSAGVKPSPTGVPFPYKPCHGKAREYCGKICKVTFDCFGEFEGFTLSTCSESRAFWSRERAVGELSLRACKERFTVSVWAEKDGCDIYKIIVHC